MTDHRFMKKIILSVCLFVTLISLTSCVTGGRGLSDVDREMLKANPHMAAPR